MTKRGRNSAALWPRRLAHGLLVNERILRDFFKSLRCTAGRQKEATRHPQSVRGELASHCTVVRVVFVFF